MNAMTPTPKDSPLMIAWEAYKATDDYANTKKWALHDTQHVEGSLWGAFMSGFLAANPDGASSRPTTTDRPRDDMTPRRRELVAVANGISREIGASLKARMPANAGFALLVFDYGDGGWMTYVSSAQRADMLKAMRELIEHLEAGGGHV